MGCYRLLRVVKASAERVTCIAYRDKTRDKHTQSDRKLYIFQYLMLITLNLHYLSLTDTSLLPGYPSQSLAGLLS